MQVGVKLFNEMVKIFESNKMEEFKRKDSTLCIKLIPCIDRIKIEKAQVARDRYLKKLDMSADEAEVLSSISFD
jgi:hypothetical protein